jgi:hypothetical protein
MAHTSTTGASGTLTHIHPRLPNHASIVCFAEIASTGLRCGSPARYLSERGVPVCGQHTNVLQAYTLADPGKPATNQF